MASACNGETGIEDLSARHCMLPVMDQREATNPTAPYSHLVLVALRGLYQAADSMVG
jgi:hypothetical protein